MLEVEADDLRGLFQPLWFYNLIILQVYVISNFLYCTSSILFIAQGQSIIPMLTGEVIPVMELLSSMKSHSVPEEIDVSPYVLCILNKRKTPPI